MPVARRSPRTARRARTTSPRKRAVRGARATQADPLAKLEFRVVGPFRGGRVGAGFGPLGAEEVQRVCRALREAQQRWQALAVGQSLTVSWPLDKQSKR